MSDLRDYLAEFPIDVLSKVEVDTVRISIPAKIDTEEFYTLFQADIDSDVATPVKSIFISAMTKQEPQKPVMSLLMEHVRYG